MNLPQIIGLYSSAPQSGKSTTAEFLMHRYGYERVKFAGTLKAMVRAFLLEMGMPAADIESYIEGAKKEEVIPALGVSSRRILVSIGTDWGRNMISPSLWVDAAMARIESLLAQGKRIAIDDVRFINEAKMLRGKGAQLWRVVNPRVAPLGQLGFEGMLDDLDFDYVIHNSSSFGDLEQRIHAALHVYDRLAAAE
jgi:hypothetical protein